MLTRFSFSSLTEWRDLRPEDAGPQHRHVDLGSKPAVMVATKSKAMMQHHAKLMTIVELENVVARKSQQAGYEREGMSVDDEDDDEAAVAFECDNPLFDSSRFDFASDVSTVDSRAMSDLSLPAAWASVGGTLRASSGADDKTSAFGPGFVVDLAAGEVHRAVNAPAPAPAQAPTPTPTSAMAAKRKSWRQRASGRFSWTKKST